MASGSLPPSRCLFRVKLRRTHCEHMFSALPLISDIARCRQHVSKVPTAEVTLLVGTHATRETDLNKKSRGPLDQPIGRQCADRISGDHIEQIDCSLDLGRLATKRHGVAEDTTHR